MIRLRNLLQRQARLPPAFNINPRRTVAVAPRVRHVRFKRPWLRPIISKFFLYGAAFHIWSTFILSRFDDDDTHDDANASPESSPDSDRASGISSGNYDLVDEEDEEEDDALFVPLTWSWMQEGELYTASDPEWKEFVRLSQDRTLLTKLRFELAQMVLKSARPQLSPILGNQLSLTGFWFVHQFPHRAPPEYVRSGLEFNDEGIAWVTKTIDPELGDRLQAFMKPVHVALAMKEATWLFAKRKLNRLTGQEVQLQERTIITGRETINPLTSREQALPEKSPETVSDSSPPPTHPSAIISSLQRLPLPDIRPGSDLHLASVAFRLRLKEAQARQPPTPRRGTMFISGPVGLRGPNGFCRFEVRGEYDPAKPGWRTIEMKLRDVNLKHQRPLRERGR